MVDKMDKQAKIYVAGHTGLVGQSIVQLLQAQGYQNLITRTHRELDLCDSDSVQKFFAKIQPEYVILAAAKVGGIYANSHYPAEFVYQNLAIQTNVIHQAKEYNIRRLLFLGSSCIYPRDCPQPIKEEYLLTSPLEASNRPYAVAKIAGIEMCWAYNRQYQTQFMAVMPTNLYGPGDNYDLKTSHVIPALIRKMHEAKVSNQDTVEIWGTGTPKREFMYSADLADACVHLLNLDDIKFKAIVGSKTQAPLINIGVGKDITIAQLAEQIAKTVGYNGQLKFNPDYPDGTPRKVLDVSRVAELGWQAKTSFVNGLNKSYQAFRQKDAVLSRSQASSAGVL